ncbi:uncharacterized protein LOC143180811 [Calliopsis andreniformis]|uniref:uncharacterized protein LOC143180811 n=1 Tax=Calliopsis andreniformis TaxID=337506 RepID=UPI003FCE517A
MLYSCLCCQSVTIFYTKAQKNLCVRFTYLKDGLKIDVRLNSDIIKTILITDYKPLKFCANVPGCLFSSACVNVLELNQFPRSITACLRLDIFTKKRLWELNYDCVSISTELPMMASNGTIQVTNGTGGTSTTTMKTMTTSMTSSQMTMATTMIEMETEETTLDVEIITVPGNVTTAIMDID